MQREQDVGAGRPAEDELSIADYRLSSVTARGRLLGNEVTGNVREDLPAAAKNHTLTIVIGRPDPLAGDERPDEHNAPH